MNEQEYKEKFDLAINHLKVELGQIRTGRATPSLVENIKINVYDTYMPIVELATVSVTDPRSLLISPWDKTIVEKVAKGITDAGTGLSAAVDGENIRINIPPLTQERREEFTKIVAQKSETAKVAIRQIRHDFVERIRKQKDDGEISVDDEKRLHEKLDEVVGSYNNQIDELRDAKSEELMTV